MKKSDQGVTRRDFIRGAAGMAFVGAATPAVPYNPLQEKEKKVPVEKDVEKKMKKKTPSKVVLIRHAKVLDGEGKVDPKTLESMLDDGLNALLGETESKAAWKSLVKAEDIVGIKSNVWRFLPTPKALEEAIQERLINAGVAKENIGIDDRGVLSHPVFKKATALINVRPLRTHHWSGVGSLIKNYIMFSHIPLPSWHGDSCADLAGLWDLPIVKGKTRLNILVMLTPLFHGKGPHHFQAKYTWEYKGLIIGKDPVAVDATGVRILEAKRKEFFGEDQPFSVPPKHITVAEKKFSLGVADPERIDLVKLGWDEEVLI